MVSLRSGTNLQNGNAKAANSPKTKTASANKKRKASEASSSADYQENVPPPSTPPPESNTPANLERNEKTPGRVGPIKHSDHSLDPDIKPFKGPPGKKVRKTPHEKNEEYRQFALDNEDHTFHELHVCYAKGPNGSPTYDKSGFQLDYGKVADWMAPKPCNKGAVVRGMDRSIERWKKERKEMAEIFFEKGEAPSDDHFTEGDDYWKDRVSKDLGVPWHKIEVKHFEEWEKRGFPKARREEYENPSKKEWTRMMGLMSGASLRK
jgi:hypothetical protein